MNNTPSAQENEVAKSDAPGTVAPERRSGPSKSRLIGGALFLSVLALGFWRDLVALVAHASANDLHSHIILVPFISAYLIYIYRERLPRDHTPSWGLAAIAALGGATALALARHYRGVAQPISQNDYLALVALSLILFVLAGGFVFLGRRWMWAAVFPCAFLVFAIPLPDGVVDLLENCSKNASAEVANAFS